MSAPNLRRADLAMTEDQMRRALGRGFAGGRAAVGGDGYPPFVPELYIWGDGLGFLHGPRGGGGRKGVVGGARV